MTLTALHEERVSRWRAVGDGGGELWLRWRECKEQGTEHKESEEHKDSEGTVKRDVRGAEQRTWEMGELEGMRQRDGK